MRNETLLYYDVKMEHFAWREDGDERSIRIIDGGDLYYYAESGKVE